MMLKNRRHDIKPNDTKHNETQNKGLVYDTQHKWLPAKLDTHYNNALHDAEFYYAEYRCAECRYAECRGADVNVINHYASTMTVKK